MSKEAQLEALSHNEGFIALLDELHAQRESFILSMHDAPTERLQQLSGRILMADEVLETWGYRKIQDRRRQKA